MTFVEEHQPDILCLQETKASQSQAEINFPMYQEYWNPATKKGYSGTAIFSTSKPLQVIMGFPQAIIQEFDVSCDAYGDPNQEGRVLAAEYAHFWLVTVYTPNSKRELTRLELRRKHWDPAFLAYLKRLEQQKPVIFCGDLNVAHTENDLANPKTNHGSNGFTDEERYGFQMFIDAGFVDAFRLFKQGNGYYTWWSHLASARTKNIGWRIDYFLLSQGVKDKVHEAEIYPAVQGSDHCPISITIDL
jgi:exodeoxyribonuclease-3